MTNSLPQNVRNVFDSFITTEFVTVDSRQQPIAWPVTPYYEDGGQTIDVTTGVGYPKKAEDARRNPRVALLFSDPTGSGIESGIQVLVQGAAEIDDADLRANAERYRREALEKLPATKDMLPPKFLEGLLGWYFERLYVKVRPERVFVWAEGDISSEPEVHGTHMEEVRSGHTEEPQADHAAPGGGSVAWDGRISELGRRHPTAVLAWVSPDGFPLAVRVPVGVDEKSRRIDIQATPAGLPLMEGRVCLTAHAHGEEFKWQENFQVRGDLVREGDSWRLVPHRMVGGFELPKESQLAGLRRNFRKSVRFYKTRKRVLKEREARDAAGS
jgi:hypothetical protein